MKPATPKKYVLAVDTPNSYKKNERMKENKKTINIKYNLFPGSPNLITKLIFVNTGFVLTIASTTPKMLKKICSN